MKNLWKIELESSSARRFAFTLAEIAVVFMIIAVIAAATIGIQKSRLNYVTKFMDYAALTNLKTIVAELISAGCDTTKDTGCGTTIKLLPTHGHETAGPAINLGLCDRTIELINVVGTTDCSQTANDGTNFATAIPNFTTTNGAKWFNFGSNPTYIGSIPGYILGTGTDYVNEVYTIYVDIDGTKGKSTFNTDIMKFYINRTGTTIVPAQNSVGANSQNYLSTSVRYQVGTNYVYPLQRETFRNAACSADGGTHNIIPVAFNTTYSYCTAGVTIDAPTLATCAGQSCEVYAIKPGF